MQQNQTDQRPSQRGRRGARVAAVVAIGAGVTALVSAGSADAVTQPVAPPAAVHGVQAPQESAAARPAAGTSTVTPQAQAVVPGHDHAAASHASTSTHAPTSTHDAITHRATAFGARPGAGVQAATLTSSRPTHNWAGYLREQGGTREVSATWRIPHIAASPTGYASTWVGIDGASNRYLTQVGVGQNAEAGHTHTYAWWEVITPSNLLPEQPLRLVVRPGDLVRATVSVSHGRTTLVLRNATTGRSARHVASYAGPGTSAEWIQEDVQAGGHISPAPAWTPVTFSHATRNTAAPSLRRTEALDIVDAKGVRETETSLPNHRGDGFRVRRLAAGHWGNLS